MDEENAMNTIEGDVKMVVTTEVKKLVADVEGVVDLVHPKVVALLRTIAKFLHLGICGELPATGTVVTPPKSVVDPSTQAAVNAALTEGEKPQQ